MTPELTNVEVVRCTNAHDDAEDAAYREKPPTPDHIPTIIGMRAALSEYHRILEERGYVVVSRDMPDAILYCGSQGWATDPDWQDTTPNSIQRMRNAWRAMIEAAQELTG